MTTVKEATDFCVKNKKIEDELEDTIKNIEGKIRSFYNPEDSESHNRYWRYVYLSKLDYAVNKVLEGI